MQKTPLYAEIFSTSLGALLLEIAYTRIFSFKVVYYFTYLILGLGLLGVGAGGIALSTSRRLRDAPPEKLIPAAALSGGAAVFLGYWIISPVSLDIANAPGVPLEIAKVILVSLVLTLPFFAAGVIISSILSSRPDAARRLYGADLLGAALGCALAVPLVAWLGPPRTVMLAGLLLSLAGLRLARGARGRFVAGALMTVALAIPVVGILPLRDPTVAKAKRFEDFRAHFVFSQWSPVFRIDVATHPFHPKDLFLVFHDGQPGSGLRRFDGDFKPFEYLEKDLRALPFKTVPKAPRVLVIGAAGGHELVASLYFGASHVTGVELNPVTYSLLTKHFADITGHLAENPKVTLINGDGRWFLKQSKEEYDLIWFVAPDSYAAMNAATSGAFVLSESYLYTVEMIRESLAHLSPKGVVGAQFGEIDIDRKPNRTTRYLATARAAYKDLDVPDFGHHVMVASALGFPPFHEVVVLLGKQAFADHQARSFDARAQMLDEGQVHWLPGQEAGESAISRVIGLGDKELSRFFHENPYQVNAVRDDAPFFWHFARFRDALLAPLPSASAIVDHEDSVAERITLSFLGVVVVLAALFLFLPLVTIRDAFARMPEKRLAAAYFAALGIGFMFIEVALVQKLTLLLGYPTYSLSVTLAALLVFSGIGSMQSWRWGEDRNQALLRVLGALSVVVLLLLLFLPALMNHFVGHALPVRIALTIAVVAPIGSCLGAFMPLGLRAVAGAAREHEREYVAWAWAVNGFFSVIASILSTILAMVFGFRWLFVAALFIYALGAWALSRFPQSELRDAE